MAEKKDNRIKYNLLSGVFYQIVLIAMSFALPRLYLESFGSEVNGVLSTIKQIFTYMCLLEAGVGLATTQALYGPVAQKNQTGIDSVLSATHLYYVKTGIIYGLIVLVFAFVYGFLVPTGMNGWVVFTIVILSGIPSLFSFFVQAKYRILMEVDGRKYIITNSETVLQLLSNAGKIIVLVFTDNLILMQLVYCLLSVAQLACTYIYAKHRYKWLSFREKPDFTAISQRKSVLVHQLSAMVFNNTDIILLSVLTDFKTVSIYTIYNIFFSQVQSFITSITSGFSFALGQMFHTDRKKFIDVYRIYETLYIMATFVIYTLMAVFLLPLIQIYTGGINDADYTNPLLLFLFAIMNLLSNGKLPSNHVVEFSGQFDKTRSHAIVEMTVNIVISVFAILKWGICGAIVGTIAALICRSILMIDFANRKVLLRKAFETYRLWIINGAVFALVMILLYVDAFGGVSPGKLVISGVVHSAWIVTLYICVNALMSPSCFKSLIALIRERRKR